MDHQMRGGRQTWDGTYLSVVSENLTIDANGISIEDDAAGYSSTKSYRFTSSESIAGALYGLFAHSDAINTQRFLGVTNTITGTGATAVTEIGAASDAGAANIVFQAGGSTSGVGRWISVQGGMVFGSPTGGDKGNGTVNAVSVYDDNVLLTDWVFDLHYAGRTDVPHAGRLYSLAETATIAEQERRLPWMPSPEDFEAQRHTGGMITRLLQGQEQQQLYILELEATVTKLAARLAALEDDV